MYLAASRWRSAQDTFLVLSNFCSLHSVKEWRNSCLSAPSRERSAECLDVGPGRRPIIVSEIGIQAIDAEAAIRQSTVAIWPPNAIGIRILNPEGHKVFEQLKPDRR